MCNTKLEFYKQQREVSINNKINASQSSYSDGSRDSLMLVDMSKEIWILKHGVENLICYRTNI
jgi:hypothetical protein